MTQILILGGGLSGFYIARDLEKDLQQGEAEVTLLDMRGGCVYQPFLAEVVGGSVEGRHIQTPFAMHLKKTKIVRAKVTSISVERKEVAAIDCAGNSLTLSFDALVVALGAVTRTLPIPGIAENAVGLKATEEAEYIRDTLLSNLQAAASLPKGSPERARLMTFVCVGGGFSGMEGFSEAYDLARKVCKRDSRLDPAELNFHLIEAADKVFPELVVEQSTKAVRHVEKLGAHIHLKTFVQNAEGGLVKTSDGATYDAGIILWTAGAMANPVLQNTDLPLEPRGRITCGADLRVRRDGEVVDGIWAVGDCSCVPDLTGHGLPDGTCAPTAQHSMRQSKVLEANLLASLRGGEMAEYKHENAGMVAGLGTCYGAFTSGALTKNGFKVRFNGWLAWMAHRFYHGLALPSWERKLRVWGDWVGRFLFRRDLADVSQTTNPRGFFEEFAAKTK